jgi:hypothetical protein
MQAQLRNLLRRRPRLAAAGAVGAVVVAAVVVGLGIGLFGSRPTADASPTPSASANPSAPPGSTPPEPSASPPPDALLLQVSVDGLRMRATASTGADIVRSLDRGEVVRVMSGPVDAEGYAWYEVVALDSDSGWVAMGDGADPWLEAVPAEPSTSPLLLRFRRDGSVTPRMFSAIPVFPPDLTLTADGRVVLGWTNSLVRQLSPSGLAQIRRDVLDLPLLQQTADYDVEHLPNAPDVGPPHEVGFNTFTLGEATARVVVTAVAWLGPEDGVYWVPSAERQGLEEVAIHLLGVETWLSPAAWTEPVARPYVSSSYLFWIEAPTDMPPSPEVDVPSLTGAAWPFDGPIEQFGDPVGQARCGYLELGQAFETLRLMRELGVPTFAFGADRQLALDGVGSGTLATDAGWFSFFLTPRSPDGYPSCAD